MTTPRESRGVDGYACPCCRLLTLEARDMWEICRECGWEDDGQDDHDADEVRGGPNGSQSLTDARRRYAAVVEADDADSAAAGGAGVWRSEAERRLRADGDAVDSP